MFLGKADKGDEVFRDGTREETKGSRVENGPWGEEEETKLAIWMQKRKDGIFRRNELPPL